MNENEHTATLLQGEHPLKWKISNEILTIQCLRCDTEKHIKFIQKIIRQSGNFRNKGYIKSKLKR